MSNRIFRRIIRKIALKMASPARRGRTTIITLGAHKQTCLATRYTNHFMLAPPRPLYQLFLARPTGWQWVSGSMLGGLREGRCGVRWYCWRGVATVGLCRRVAFYRRGRRSCDTGEDSCRPLSSVVLYINVWAAHGACRNEILAIFGAGSVYSTTNIRGMMAALPTAVENPVIIP